jgi:transcriptional regulator with XRE-family HTH domain
VPEKRSPEDEAYFKGMGLAIIELRESCEISKSDLTSKAKIVRSTLRRIELGETDARWGTLRRLASALMIPLDALMEMADELAPASAGTRGATFRITRRKGIPG